MALAAALNLAEREWFGFESTKEKIILYIGIREDFPTVKIEGKMPYVCVKSDKPTTRLKN
jgi:hypothetical protein